MTTEIRISNVDFADDTELRSMYINIGKYIIKTPTKSIITKNFYKGTSFIDKIPIEKLPDLKNTAPKIADSEVGYTKDTRVELSELFKKPENSGKLTNINEIFLKFDNESIDRMNKNLNCSQKKNGEVEKSKQFLKGCPTLCFLEYKNKDELPLYPNNEEITALTNTAYSFSDMTPIPSIPKIARNITIDNFDDFQNYLSNCYDEIMVRNKKKIMGYIPTVPPFFVKDIVDFYLDRGINGYYIDFDGTMITSHLTMINALKRELKKRGYEEKSFIYYVNLSYGKAINDENVLSARDMLAFGHGLDGYGGIHVGPKRGKQFYDWLKTKKNISENSNRLFNKDNYGYYKLESPETNLEEIFPNNDSIYPIEILKNNNKSAIRRYSTIINLQQQIIESMNLKELINESPGNTINYFENKKMVSKSDIKLLSKR